MCVGSERVEIPTSGEMPKMAGDWKRSNSAGNCPQKKFSPVIFMLLRRPTPITLLSNALTSVGRRTERDRQRVAGVDRVLSARTSRYIWIPRTVIPGERGRANFFGRAPFVCRVRSGWLCVWIGTVATVWGANRRIITNCWERDARRRSAG